MSKVFGVLKSVVKGERPVTCESCGEEFNCGVSLKGCWCSKIELSEADRAELKSRYNDCLCTGCLEKLANKGSNQSV
jgi:hypothetical protein